MKQQTSTKTPEHLAEVLQWIDQMAERGIYPPSSARFRRSALTQLTSVLAEDEPYSPDELLQRIDELAGRWTTKNNAKPETARTYASRARTVLSDYVAYREDPLHFRPRSAKRPKSDQAKKKSTASSKKAKSADSGRERDPSPVEVGDTASEERHGRTFPLGPNRGEFAFALPEQGVTARDVLKVTCHLLTFAEDFDPTNPAQAQFFALARSGSAPRPHV